ncbi:MAG: type II secretion system F family protein [Verrucomicrobiota bacterium]|nr:type II secretion system F family protein [Verrucomicrobiota bacterium]
MPIFRYWALSDAGEQIKATIEAEDLQEAKRKLLRLRVIATKIEAVQKKEKAFAREELLSLTREIGRLLQAGLPLYETLIALGEKYRGHKAEELLLSLGAKIKIGHSLSHALSCHPRAFDVLYISMVANAEKTGRLIPCFEELAQLLSRQMQVRKQIVGALLYPSLLAVFCLVVFSSLLFFVVPALKELFDDRELHPFTQIVFFVSDWACNSKVFLLSFVLSLFSLFLGACFFKPLREKVFSLLLFLPWIRSLWTRISLIRFMRAMAALLEGGIPLVGALAQARTLLRHPTLAALIAEAEERVAEGVLLSTCFTHPIIPPLVPRMFAIAEESGKLSFSMHQVAQIYEEELEMTLANFTQLAQPILLLFLGGLVGFVLLSVLLPLTDVSSFAM